MALLTSKSRPLAIFTPLHPLAERDFGIFWAGAFLSSIGFWVQAVGQGWQVLQLTQSPLQLGLVAFASTLPNAALSLLGGVIVDRMNRRYLLLWSQVIYMITSLLLGLFTTLHIITVWQIIVMALLNGICGSVGMPAWQTFIGDLVPVEELKQGIALNSMQFNLSRVVGPAIAGLSIGLIGIAGSYYLNSLSYIAVIIPLLLVHPSQKQRSSVQQSLWQGLGEGMQYLRQSAPLQIILLLQFMIAFLVYPYATLLPIFADSIFHIGATGLGVLNAASGTGALIGSIFTVMGSRHIRPGVPILVKICLIAGLVSLTFLMLLPFNAVLLILVLLGACTVMSSIITNTTVQTMVPEKMRGRVLSIWVMIAFGIAPLGNLVEGWAAQMIGAPFTLAIGGGLCIVVALLIIGLQRRAPTRSTVSLPAQNVSRSLSK